MCFCTQRRLQLLNRDQARRGETSGYDNKCRGLTEAQVNHNLEMNLPYVIRFKVGCTVKILKFGTPQTIAIIVLKIEKFDVTLH